MLGLGVRRGILGLGYWVWECELAMVVWWVCKLAMGERAMYRCFVRFYDYEDPISRA